VADVAAHWRVDHRTLVWSGAKPESGLGEAAREARYRLLATAVRSSRSTHLVTAHHLDDQAETVLLRLAAGSGIDGLAAMRPLSPFGEGLLLARPLLGLPKARLIATCVARGLLPASDPGNRDLARPRPRLRRAAAALSREGLTPERLAQLARRAARAAEALDFHTAAAMEASGFAAGPLRADLPAWKSLAGQPEEIRLRCLIAAFGRALPREAWPRLAQTETLLARLDAALAEGRTLRATLGGLRIELSAAGALRLLAETPRGGG
jgi:tRNA(Ile)-lysidine synthase